MAMKIGPASGQVVFRRFFIVSRQFSEKEKAAILQKVEEYKRKKLARKGPNPGETAALGSGDQLMSKQILQLRQNQQEHQVKKSQLTITGFMRLQLVL